MLQDFIAANREEILAGASARMAQRGGPVGATVERHGLPHFLDQLGEALTELTLEEVGGRAEIKHSAGLHGDHLFRQGLTVAQVINTYGDICQAISGLAVARAASIGPAEFQMLNLCLDEATAGAVTAFSEQHDQAISDEGTERLGVLAHELRNALSAAMLSFASIKKGTVAVGGSTGAMLDRSLIQLQLLIDRSLADVRLDAGLVTLVRVPLWEVIEEAEIGAELVAQGRGLALSVSSVDQEIVVEADRSILIGAVANLLQNALKFTARGSTVKLRTRTTGTRVLIEIEDQCGGLPSGQTESLLRPFAQQGRDRTGLGLGLSICVKAMKTMAGELHIRDLPGAGCIFTIDLPKQPPPPSSIRAWRDQAEGGTQGSGGQMARAAAR